MKLNTDQHAALAILRGKENVFLTGAAGCGKSFLLQHYLQSLSPSTRIPVLASTGAAAILVGGRTFHSFFGLGIMEGGIQKTVERAATNKRLLSRIAKTDAIIIDEVSMISGPQLQAAERIARKAHKNSTPWGGMRIIAVGDFSQLPPVNPFGGPRPWAFLDETWTRSEFVPVALNRMMRASDPHYLAVLNEVRLGRVTDAVRAFLNSRTLRATAQEDFTSLFPHRDRVERTNLVRLESLKQTAHTFETTYKGAAKDIETFRKHSPLSDTIQLKKEAFVMIRQNDADGAWVNGSLGFIKGISDSVLEIELLRGKKRIELKPVEFTLLNADGEPVVTAKNFPISLAWAMTIHKAQGATLDSVRVDLKGAWEPGQAYVALSRARSPEGLWIDGWNPPAILADRDVLEFYEDLRPPARQEELFGFDAE